MWMEHPASPIIHDDARIARPGGRVVIHDGRIYRYTQDCADDYGTAVRAFEVTTLDTTTYAEIAASSEPVLSASGQGWNRDGMHHVDAHMTAPGSWLACVDGNRRGIGFRLW
jgi:hypothetical protein